MVTQRKAILVRLGALLAGLIVFYIALHVIVFGSQIFVYSLWHAAMQHAALRPAKNWPIVPGARLTADVVLFAYPACAGVVTTVLFWQGWPKFWGRAIVYSLVVVLILPISWINYARSDQWLNVWVQAAFNLALAVFFLMIVQGLRNIEPKAPDAKAMQIIGVLMLASFGVFLPLFFTAVFLAYASGMVTHDQIRKINEQVPLMFAGGAGAVATLLGLLEKIRGGAGAK